MSKKLLLVVLIFMLSGCKSFTDNVIIKVNEQCRNVIDTHCKLRITDVTKFEWHKMYLFPDWTLSDSIGKAIGLPYFGDDVPDDNTRILFVKNDKVVYEEDFESSAYYHSSIAFLTGINDPFYTGRKYLTPSTAVFNVDKERFCSKTDFIILRIIK